LDPKDVEAKITPQTKAILPVHMRGVPCRMEALIDIAKKHKLKIVEDVAQAIGGKYKGQYLGTLGDCGCFSFQYHKIITAGEGGMMITNDERVYDRSMGYHDTAACWRPNRYALPRFEGENFCGMNFRMGELAGAVMLAQLRTLDNLISLMKRNKQIIKEQISSIKNIRFRDVVDHEGDTGICLVWFMDSEDKAAEVAAELKEREIDVRHLYSRHRRDWHVYKYWTHLLNKESATDEGCPFSCPHYKGNVKYSPDMNPNTLDILGKAVHVNIPSQLTEDDSRLIGQIIKQVIEAV